jgi:hypothetical protein
MLGNYYLSFGVDLKQVETLTKDKILIDFTPIPLTEEWLFKFGFENIDTNDDGGDNYWYLSKTDFMLDRFFQSFTMNTSFDLEYVHQLQNLYFALTNEELKLRK